MLDVSRVAHPGVPLDFPVTAIHSALAGAQPKISIVKEAGKFYAQGTSPIEVIEAFEVCADLVEQMIPYCQRKLAAFDGDHDATVRAVLQGLVAKQWCTAERSIWIMRTTTQRLEWHLRKDTLPD
ncbi:hypothetical protein [Acidovorax sp.]|uniref:hypothetical protein n=1 Tax=Acidovorax sp. TaxID=1872122 RepID=UPI002ACDFAAF|nr:hypothetical protein [Acidovorax sp.]MDZ7865946.1 hypothetical protein [Acidovorax sp.]